MFKYAFLALAVLLCFASGAAAEVSFSLAIPATLDGPYQVRYATNLQIVDAVVRIGNAGGFSSVYGDLKGNASASSPLCANVYGFRATTGQLTSCCSCNIPANGLRSLSVYQDMLADGPVPNPVPNTLVIKLLGTRPVAGVCSAASPGAQTTGMVAWGISQQPGFFTATPIYTETPFTVSSLSPQELYTITSQCAVLQPGPHACSSCP